VIRQVVDLRDACPDRLGRGWLVGWQPSQLTLQEGGELGAWIGGGLSGWMCRQLVDGEAERLCEEQAEVGLLW
jgi:hypothetical protein